MTRNRFEAEVAAVLQPEFAYEADSFRVHMPAARYTPDWVSPDGRTVVEAKGLWRLADRRKMRLFREQHPQVKVVMVFQDPGRKIAKRSTTTYRQYAERIGCVVMALAELPGFLS